MHGFRRMDFSGLINNNTSMFYNEINVPEKNFVQRALDYVTDVEPKIIGLSGGSTPRPFYEAMGTAKFPWKDMTVFLVDERHVPPTHEESNQRLIRETLLKSAQIPNERCIFPDTSLPLAKCIDAYARSLISMIDAQMPDLVILGMGDDGHIASLFPPLSDEAMGDERLVLATTTDRFAIHDRISVSLNFLVGAKSQLLLLKGEKKKKVWEEMLASNEDERRWPMKRVLEQGNVTVITTP